MAKSSSSEVTISKELYEKLSEIASRPPPEHTGNSLGANFGGGGAFLLVSSVLFTGYLFLTGRLDNVIMAIKMPGGSLFKPSSANMPAVGTPDDHPVTQNNPMGLFEVMVSGPKGSASFMTDSLHCFADTRQKLIELGHSEAEASLQATGLCKLTLPPRAKTMSIAPRMM